MYDIKKENKVYFYGFDRLHQLQGNPWNLRGDWITIQNIRETAKRMLHQMDISEVIVVDGSYLVGREYKDLTKPNHYKQATEHVLFYDFLKSQEHFSFGLIG
jgi:hypothetical protein